jgi:hypothetical protein
MWIHYWHNQAQIWIEIAMTDGRRIDPSNVYGYLYCGVTRNTTNTIVTHNYSQNNNALQYY